MNNQVTKQLLSTSEAAKYLGVSVPTFREKRKSGEWRIPVVIVGRLHKYARKDLDAFIEQHKQAI
jgi:excisionase family DNA binding protein